MKSRYKIIAQGSNGQTHDADITWLAARLDAIRKEIADYDGQSLAFMSKPPTATPKREYYAALELINKLHQLVDDITDAAALARRLREIEQERQADEKIQAIEEHAGGFGSLCIRPAPREELRYCDDCDCPTTHEDGECIECRLREYRDHCQAHPDAGAEMIE